MNFNMDRVKIRRQHISTILLPKMLLPTKRAPRLSEYPSGNDGNNSISIIQIIKKTLQAYSHYYSKNSRNIQRFPKTLEIRTSGTTTSHRPRVRQLSKTIEGVSKITISQKKLI